MQRLVPAILHAWREAERAIEGLPPGSEEARRLAARTGVLKVAHAMATRPDADREDVVRFLREHDTHDVVTATDA